MPNLVLVALFVKLVHHTTVNPIRVKKWLPLGSLRVAPNAVFCKSHDHMIAADRRKMPSFTATLVLMPSLLLPSKTNPSVILRSYMSFIIPSKQGRKHKPADNMPYSP